MKVKQNTHILGWILKSALRGIWKKVYSTRFLIQKVNTYGLGQINGVKSKVHDKYKNTNW